MRITAEWVIDRIDELRNESHMSEYRLCELAGLTTSSMSAMRKRGTMPKLTTISKICEAFDITLSEFFRTSSEPKAEGFLSKDELTLITYVRKLPAATVGALIAYAKGLYDGLHSSETSK